MMPKFGEFLHLPHRSTTTLKFWCCPRPNQRELSRLKIPTMCLTHLKNYSTSGDKQSKAFSLKRAQKRDTKTKLRRRFTRTRLGNESSNSESLLSLGLTRWQVLLVLYSFTCLCIDVSCTQNRLLIQLSTTRPSPLLRKIRSVAMYWVQTSKS